MRSREEIKKDLDKIIFETDEKLKFEILLDIRDLLIHLYNKK